MTNLIFQHKENHNNKTKYYQYRQLSVLTFYNEKELDTFLDFHKLKNHPTILSPKKINKYVLNIDDISCKPFSIYLFGCVDEVSHPKINDFTFIDPRML